MNIKNRLKVMLFLQYFIWGCWLITLGGYLIKTLGFSGTEVGVIFSSKGLAAFFTPFLVGIIAEIGRASCRERV